MNASRPHLFREPIDDLDAGQVALVHGSIEGLSGESLLGNRAVRVAIEEAAELVFQLPDALDRAAHKHPRQLLIRKPCAAFDGIHELPLDRVASPARSVVDAVERARLGGRMHKGAPPPRSGAPYWRAERQSRSPGKPRPIRVSAQWPHLHCCAACE